MTIKELIEHLEWMKNLCEERREKSKEIIIRSSYSGSVLAYQNVINLLQNEPINSEQ